MPVCARCTGLYAGAALSAFAFGFGVTSAAFAFGFGATAARHILFAAALPTLITWTLEFAGLAAFSNATRFAAALPLGFVVAWLVMSVATSTPRHEVHGPRPGHEDH